MQAVLSRPSRPHQLFVFEANDRVPGVRRHDDKTPARQTRRESNPAPITTKTMTLMVQK